MIDDDDADDNNIIIIVIIMLMMMMILDDDELGVSIPRPPIPPSQKATALATRRRLVLDTRRLAAAFALTWPWRGGEKSCVAICSPWQKWKQIWPIHRYGYEMYEYGY